MVTSWLVNVSTLKMLVLINPSPYRHDPIIAAPELRHIDRCTGWIFFKIAWAEAGVGGDSQDIYILEQSLWAVLCPHAYVCRLQRTE